MRTSASDSRPDHEPQPIHPERTRTDSTLSHTATTTPLEYHHFQEKVRTVGPLVKHAPPGPPLRGAD